MQVLLLPLISLFISACGSGSSNSQTDGSPSEKDEDIVLTIIDSDLWVNSPTFSNWQVTTADEITVTPGTYGSLTSDSPIEVEVTYRWFVDGQLVNDISGDTLPAGSAARDQFVEVQQVVTGASGNQVSDTIGITIKDSPGTLEVNFPQGSDKSSYHFTAILYDADLPDGKGPAPIGYAPVGLTIDKDGNGTWLPDQSFLPEQLYRIGLREGDIADANIQEHFITIRSTDAWPIVASGLKVPDGLSNTVIADLDGDGNKEILGSNRHSLFINGFDGENYLQTWLYPFSAREYGDVVGLFALDIDDDIGAEIIVFNTLGVSMISDLKSVSEIVYSLPEETHSSKQIKGGASANINGQSIAAVVTADSRLIVLNLLTGEELATFESEITTPEKIVAFAELDDEPGLEIVTNFGLVIDAQTFQLKWNSNYEFGDRTLSIVDVDNDGISEVIGGSSCSSNETECGIYVISTNQQKTLHHLKPSGDVVV